jgi:hypothetical protein
MSRPSNVVAVSGAGGSDWLGALVRHTRQGGGSQAALQRPACPPATGGGAPSRWRQAAVVAPVAPTEAPTGTYDKAPSPRVLCGRVRPRG